MNIEVEIWSDYVCPFCYLQEPVVDELTREFGTRVTVRWRAYELRPDPVPTLQPDGEYLRDIWQRAVYPMAAERGMNLRLPPVQPRSRLAFEATEYARDRGKHDAMRKAIFAAFFEDGRDIGDPAVLCEIAQTLDIHPRGLERALESHTYIERVLRDETEASELGLTGVPAMVLTPPSGDNRERVLISGAQPFQAVKAAIEELLRV